MPLVHGRAGRGLGVGVFFDIKKNIFFEKHFCNPDFHEQAPLAGSIGVIMGVMLSGSKIGHGDIQRRIPEGYAGTSGTDG